MIEKTFKHASASEAGDYYQVSFDDGDDYEAKDIGGRYFLIQRQFEFPDDGTYYLTSYSSPFNTMLSVSRVAPMYTASDTSVGESVEITSTGSSRSVSVMAT
jgi:hypothetical protein